jgi:hypothetical protein
MVLPPIEVGAKSELVLVWLWLGGGLSELLSLSPLDPPHPANIAAEMVDIAA